MIASCQKAQQNKYINHTCVHSRILLASKMPLCHRCQNKTGQDFNSCGWECITDEVMGGTSEITELSVSNNSFEVSGCVKHVKEGCGFILMKRKIEEAHNVASIEFEINQRGNQRMDNDVSVLIFPENCKFKSTTTLDNTRLFFSKLFTTSQCPAWYSHKINNFGKQNIALADFSYQIMASTDPSKKYQQENLEYVGFLFEKCGNFKIEISNIEFK